MPRRFRLLLCVLVLLFAVACDGDDEVAVPSPRPSPSPSPSPEPVLCPLTGLPAPNDVDLDRRVLAIKIANSREARPQAGLEHADIVYETIAEGGLTRLMALFHCDDADPIGPVRSARAVDPDILMEYGSSIFGYSGAHPQVKAKVQGTRGIVIATDDTVGLYYRQRGRPRPHDLFTSTRKLRGVTDATGIPETGLVFDPAAARALVTPGASTPGVTSPAAGAAPPPPPPPAQAPGNSLTFSFSGPETRRFTYDPASSSYLRFHGDRAHNTAAGDQVTAKNVIVLKVAVTQGQVRDAAGNFSPEIRVSGSGEAIVLRGGTSVTGTWNRATLGEKTKLLDAAGQPISVLPGNTWIHLLPSSQPVTVG